MFTKKIFSGLLSCRACAMACPSGQNVQLTPVNSSRITFLFSGVVLTIVWADAQIPTKGK